VRGGHQRNRVLFHLRGYAGSRSNGLEWGLSGHWPSKRTKAPVSNRRCHYARQSAYLELRFGQIKSDADTPRPQFYRFLGACNRATTGETMPFPPKALGLVQSIKSTLDIMIANTMSKKDHDFNNAPANAVQNRLDGVIKTLNSSTINYDDLDNHLRYVDYVVAMIATYPKTNTTEAFGNIMQEPDHTTYSADQRCTMWIQHTEALVDALGTNIAGKFTKDPDSDPVIAALQGIDKTLSQIASSLPSHYGPHGVRGVRTMTGASSKS